jgi:hypothetical protein
VLRGLLPRFAGGVACVPLGLRLSLGQRLALLALAALEVELGGGARLFGLLGLRRGVGDGLLLGGLGFGPLAADLLERGGAEGGALASTAALLLLAYRRRPRRANARA